MNYKKLAIWGVIWAYLFYLGTMFWGVRKLADRIEDLFRIQDERIEKELK